MAAAGFIDAVRVTIGLPSENDRMLAALAERKVGAHVVVTVHPRAEVDAAGDFTEWIDSRWVEMDDAVARFTQAAGV